jgi:hypothetical protein
VSKKDRSAGSPDNSRRALTTPRDRPPGNGELILNPDSWRKIRKTAANAYPPRVRKVKQSAFSFVAGAAHPDATQSVTANFPRGTERKIQHSAVCKGPPILDRAINFLAVLEIGDDEDRAELFRAVSTGDFVGMEALAARVPSVFPINGGFLVLGGWARDAAHPDLLKRIGVRRQRNQHERKRSQSYSRDEHSTCMNIKRPMVGLWLMRGQ